ncbi:tetratricopeptide repeat protein [Aquabacterium sp.]|uniref:tetratricopeptide repeat protein n=1 Tax=Aquabacterium sp. TaxID=1872578 RepID=UPI003D6CF7BE
MTSFLILALLMVVAASLFIVPTLWRRTPSGLTKAEPPERWTAASLVSGVAVVTAGLYLVTGAPQALGPQAEASAPAEASGADSAAPAVTPAQIEGMVARLAQRLQTQPNDAAGWRMLAKSYETLERFPQAVGAYQRLLALQPPDADLLTDYAVTLGMSQGQTLVGEPEALINRALQLNPGHIQALALSGSAAFEAHDYDRAQAQWTRILSLIPPDAEMRSSIERNIAKARSLALAEQQGAQGRPSPSP